MTSNQATTKTTRNDRLTGWLAGWLAGWLSRNKTMKQTNECMNRM